MSQATSTIAVPSVNSEQPLVTSYTWHSEVPSRCAPEKGSSEPDASGLTKGLPCVLGVDEAGRGPVLGPLVYGIAYCPLEDQPSLAEIGFADSKALTAERRDTLLDALCSHTDSLGWAVRVMSPQDISAGMLRRHPTNLNAQSAQATVSLIADVLNKGIDVTEIFVDTVGDPKSYARLLSSHFPRHAHIKWTVTSKADALFPVVGAASIAAKVTRDRILEGWVYAERGMGRVHVDVVDDDANQESVGETAPVNEEKTNDKRLAHCAADLNDAEELGEHKSAKRRRTSKARGSSPSKQVRGKDEPSDVWDVGSGYPGDPRTVAYLQRTLDPVFGWPGLIRFSWATARTMLEEKTRETTASAPASSEALTARAQRPQGTRAHKPRWVDEPTTITRFFTAASSGDSRGQGEQGSPEEEERKRRARPSLLKELGLVGVATLS